MTEKFSREEFAAKLGANGDPKLTAVADFAARLLNGPLGETVARIMLFGSVARGEAGPESDIDLLVIGTADLHALEEQASAIAYELLLDKGELISPTVYSVSDAEYPTTWFLENVIQGSREVFRMNDAELRRTEAQGWWVLAVEYLRQARLAGDAGSFRLAVDGAYNAAELAVKGFLVLRVERMPTSHGGLVQIFSREYVATGEIDRLIGHRLAASLDLRGRARYRREAEITAEHVTQVATLAQNLIDLLERTLSALERQQDDNPN